MATAFVKKHASKHRLVYEITGDGDATVTTRSSALLIGDCVDGPLKTALQAAYVNQAAMRDAFLYGNPVRIRTHLFTRVNDVTAEKNQVSVDVNTDGTTATRPELRVEMSDTTGQKAVVEIEYIHSIVA